MDAIRQIKNTIVPVVKNYDINKVYLFGSYARGEATAASDIDLLLDTTHCRISIFKIAGLKAQLEAELGKPIDLVSLGGIHPYIEKEIMKDRILLYDKYDIPTLTEFCQKYLK